jgi:hypothetical protein
MHYTGRYDYFYLRCNIDVYVNIGVVMHGSVEPKRTAKSVGGIGGMVVNYLGRRNWSSLGAINLGIS